jgi:dipeptidyl aminopeptidase/acylaminoacyl peptidase
MDRSFTILLLLFIGVSTFLSCGLGIKDEIPIESFFNKSDKSNFRLSPNGKFISYIQKHEGIENLYVMDLENDILERITNETDIGIRFSFWANNEEIVFLKYRPPGDSLRLMAVNKDALSVRYVLPPSDVRMRWVGPQRVNDRNELLISLNSRDSSVFDAYRIHIVNCTLDLVSKNPGNIVEWVPDINGEIRAAISSDGHTETILYRASEKETFIPVIKNNFKTKIQPLGFSSEKPNRLFALSNLGRDKKALVEFNLLTGKEENILFIHPDVDVSKGGYSWQNGDMNFAVFNTWKSQKHFFNKEIENIYNEIDKQLNGYVVDLEEVDSSFTKFLIRAYTDIDPGAYYYYDLKKNMLKELGKVNSSLDPEQLSPVTNVSYFTKDGAKIHAYLTYPENSTKTKLPVIVIPHNGPSSRTIWGYDAEVQFLASRGFAVFQPNYRGSTGYGKDFWTSGFKEWGKRVQEDIKEGVEWLIEEGIADPKRIGIYGFNFGGYSALHGACFNSDTYSCAASYSGMTNLYTYLKEVPPYFTPYMEMFHEMIGNPKTDGDYLRANSPVFHADKIKIPLFIAQGGKDYRNNVNETNLFIKELRKNGADITYMLKAEEDNVFRNDENVVDFYRALEAFFEKHLLK